MSEIGGNGNMFLIDGYELGAASLAPYVGKCYVGRRLCERGVEEGAPDWPCGVWGGRGMKYEEPKGAAFGVI